MGTGDVWSAQGAGDTLGEARNSPPVEQGIWEAEVQLPACHRLPGGPRAGNPISLCLGLLSVKHRK